MDIKNISIARKYATAFLNLYLNKIDEKSFLNIISAFDYLKLNKYLFQYIALPHLNLDQKKELISLLLNKFDLPFEFNKLTDLLLKNNRINLFIEILREMVLVYQQKESILLFDVFGSNNIEDDDLKVIKNFLERKTKKRVIESFKIDKSLIAGIKLQNNNYLWENSISSKLKNLKKLR